MSKLTKDQINVIVSKNKPTFLPIEKNGSEAFMIVGEPTVVPSQAEGAFRLNSPSKFQKLGLLSQYIDRVVIRDTFSEEDIERVTRLMKGRASSFAKTIEADSPVHEAHYGFEMPGYGGVFCREIDNHQGHYELRYMLEVYKEVE